MAAQLLDGTTAAIAISSAVSTAVLGYVVQHFGDVTGFVTMAAGTAIAGGLLWTLLPETKPDKYDD